MDKYTQEQKEAIRVYNKRFIDELNNRDIIQVLGLEKDRNGGRYGYICPLCGSGKGGKGTGGTVTRDRRRFMCWKPGCPMNGNGRGQDIYGSLQAVTGKRGYEILRENFPSYNIAEALNDRSRRTERTQWPARGNNPPAQQMPAEGRTEALTGGQELDYTGYYRECREHITEPAAQAYLTFRGLSNETAARYWIGYDKATGFLIIPAASSFYIARNTNTAAKMRYKNPAGASTALFNVKALYNDAGRPVFITEGAIDALSVIEAGGEAVALNGTSNTRKLLEQIASEHTRSTLVLCLDKDDAGRKATAALAEGLRGQNVPFIEADITGEHKDANEALTADRAAFLEAVKATERKIRFPGLLTAERAMQILEDVDDHFLQMPHFPQLSATLKLKAHDNVVIAADTGAGKSSLALNFLHELQDTYPALYINLEMDDATVLQRLIAIHTGITLDEIEGYKQDQRTRAKVNAAIHEITARREIQLFNNAYDLDQIESLIQVATAGRSEPTIVFIDTGLLVTTTGKTSSRYERFTEISERLRRIARLNNVIMFVLLQQNRESKKEDRKEPKNSSLKESGSWENDATKIMFLWQNPDTNCKEIVITKNRSGETGKVGLNYYPHTQAYSEAVGGFVPCDDPTPFDDDDIPTF